MKEGQTPSLQQWMFRKIYQEDATKMMIADQVVTHDRHPNRDFIQL